MVPSFLSHLSRTRQSIVGLLVLVVLGASAVVALFAVLGPFKAVAVALGLVLIVTILEWPIIGLVAVVLSGTCFQIIGSEAITGLPLSLGKTFGLLAMGAWLLKAARDRIPCTYSPQLLALLGYLGAMLVVRALVHPDQPAVENGFMRFLQVAIVFWLVANLAGTDRRALLVGCGSVTAGLAICGFIGALEYFVPSLAIESDDPALETGAIGAVLDRESLEGIDIRRVTGGLGDANWLAATVVAVLPLNLFWWRLAEGFVGRSLVLGVTALQLLVLMLSYTRSGFLALAVAILFLAWRRVISIRLLAAGGMVAILFALIWLPPGFMERVFSTKYLVDGGSTPMRQDLTGSALNFAFERPILGYGFGQFGVEFIDRLNNNNKDLSNRISAWGFELTRSIDEGRELVQNIGAHNLYLEIVVEYGLLGLVPFVAFMVLALNDLRCAERWGNDEQRLLAICIAAGLIAFYVCGLFVHAKYLKILWLMAGLAAAQRRVVLTGTWTDEPDTHASGSTVSRHDWPRRGT